MKAPLITVVIPSYQQGQYLEETLQSVFAQDLPCEVMVMDGGSQDQSVDIIKSWEHKLTFWRSHSDLGQSAAINEGVALGKAPYVCWMNSDDGFLPGGLKRLWEAIESMPNVPAVYGRALNVDEKSQKKSQVWVEPFNEKRLALRNVISQPATLIRRNAWEAVGGLNPKLHLAMDYDLWWRLYRWGGALKYVDALVAFNREHQATKTQRNRKAHYQEAIDVVREHYGRVPLKWWLYQPYAVWFK